MRYPYTTGYEAASEPPRSHNPVQSCPATTRRTGSPSSADTATGGSLPRPQSSLDGTRWRSERIVSRDSQESSYEALFLVSRGLPGRHREHVDVALRSQPSEDSGAMQIRANELLAEHVTQCADDLRDLRPIGRC